MSTMFFERANPPVGVYSYLLSAEQQRVKDARINKAYEALLKKYRIHDRRKVEENLQELDKLKKYLDGIKQSDEITKLSKELTALEVLPGIRWTRLSRGFFEHCPGSQVTSTVIMAAIIKAMGYTGLATLGAIASAAAVGSVVVSMPLAAIWAWYGPTNTSFNIAEWDLKITLLNLIVSAGISILGLAVGSLILGTTMSPTLFIGLGVASSIGIFLLMTGIGIARTLPGVIEKSSEVQNTLKITLAEGDIIAILGKIDNQIEEIKKNQQSNSMTNENSLSVLGV